MQRAFASLAAAAVLGVAGFASAATTTVLDEGYNGFNGYAWAAYSKDTTTAYTGSNSLKIDSHATAANYIHVRVALDTPVSTDTVDPASASLSFAYKFTYDSGPATRTLEFGLQQGDWGYLGGFFLGGTTVLTGDGAWHTATIPFTGWSKAPTSPTQMDWITIRNPANNWEGGEEGPNPQEEITLHMDNFVFTSPVPEPTTLGVLAVGSMLALRRRRA